MITFDTRKELTIAVGIIADRLEKRTGIHWGLDCAAPETLAEVRSWVAQGYLPISRNGLAGSVYLTDYANAQFRYVHDMGHALDGYPFTLEGETALAKRQAHELARVLIEGEVHGARLVRCLAVYLCDTIGQAQYHEQTGGGFVANQLQFAREYAAQFVYMAKAIAQAVYDEKGE